MDRNERDGIPSWDGEAAGWQTYVRKVRLAWERTPEKKKSLLGAALASRLQGRAWEISHGLNHARLQSRTGPVYLRVLGAEVGKKSGRGSRTCLYGFAGNPGSGWCNGLPNL